MGGPAQPADASAPDPIHTPDRKLRVYLSAVPGELAPELAAARSAIERLRLTPVTPDDAARPHGLRDLSRAYLAQSDVFVGIYCQQYGPIAPGAPVSPLEDEYLRAGDRPKLIYVKTPAPQREPHLAVLLQRVQADDTASYKPFVAAEDLRNSLADDLAILLSEEFAQPQAPRAAPTGPGAGGLPLPRRSLVNRERELALAQDLLLREDVGLVTLTGPGGSGKSRLVLHIAQALAPRFADGVAWVPLAALADPAQVLPAVAHALDIREVPAEPLAETVRAAVRARHLLLLLDNFEHVLAAAPVVADLLGAGPRLRVLVTSRAPLHLSMEHELPVPPLALPDADRAHDRAGIAQSAAVALFIQRARDVAPGFAVTDETAPVVAEICARLDGLPLAIELAAARSRLLSPRALLARLERRLPMLTGGPRDLPARQQTLRAAIAWSYDLLDAPEQALFRRLSVFRGGFTLEAAAAVAASDAPRQGHQPPGPDVLDGMWALVDQSLLVQTEGPGGEPRFRLLQTVREFALERLAESAESATVGARHAAVFVALAERAEPSLAGPERTAWLALLEQEYADLLAALDWGEAHDVRLAARLAGALIWFWYFSGRLAEWEHWIQSLVIRPELAAADMQRAELLFGAGALARLRQDYAAALAPLEESLPLFRAAGRPRPLAHALAHVGMVHTGRGDPRAALPAYEDALAECRRSGDRWWEAFTLCYLGGALAMAGDRTGAADRLAESLATAEAVRDPWLRGVVLVGSAGVAARQADWSTARERYAQAAEQLRLGGDKNASAHALLGWGEAAIQTGRVDEADGALSEALARFRELGLRSGAGRCLAGLARVAAERGELGRAARLSGAAPAPLPAVAVIVHAPDNAGYDRALSAARERLGEAAFAAERAAGEGLSADAAIGYALEET